MRIAYRVEDIPPAGGRGNRIMQDGKYNLHPKDGAVYHKVTGYSGYSTRPDCQRHNSYNSWGYRIYNYVTTGHFSGTVPDDFDPYYKKKLEVPKRASKDPVQDAFTILQGKKIRRMQFPKWVSEPWAKPCKKCFPPPVTKQENGFECQHCGHKANKAKDIYRKQFTVVKIPADEKRKMRTYGYF